MSKRSKIQIRYRSGQIQEVTCTKFNIKYSNEHGDTRVTSVEWADIRPAPLFMNLDAIESIWEII